MLERIGSEGLAHYSYIIGDRNQAAVIDPRRDVERYIEIAEREGMTITDIFETHRNEDYVIGSCELRSRTGGKIWHAEKQLDYGYGSLAEEGKTWSIGRLKLKAMNTPGHTLGSVSYLLHDPDGEPWIIFTGDALFAGDVGRVDFYGEERLKEMSFKLYDSIFNKILPLGDGIIICPAHGAGSVCGESIAEREWTTIGMERKRNTKLQVSNKEEFSEKAAEMREYPPYFATMERLNRNGPGSLSQGEKLKHMNPEEFQEAAVESLILDVRSNLSFGSAHIPGSISIWLDGVPSFAGWFLTYDKPVLLVGGDTSKAVTYLRRMGFDNVIGTLSGGMLAWHMSGRKSCSVNTLTVQELCGIIDGDKKPWILDVRSEGELEEKGEIEDAHNIHLTRIPENMHDIPKDRDIYIFCGSGLRSMTTASLLKREGWEELYVVLGGIQGWTSTTCPLK
ncbi:MAG: MBL fold metallo-hydrolase [Thermoplasmata archaeon]